MRREVLSLLVTLCPLVLAATRFPPAGPSPDPSVPPTTEKKPVVDEYFGTAVSDDYRWLETWGDPAVQAWSEAQNAHARFTLDRLAGVAEIGEEVRRIASFPSPGYSGLAFRGGTLFAIKNQPPKQQPFLVTLGSADRTSSERALVDPNAIDPKGTTSIDFYVPSLDGRLVAVSMSEGGSESGSVSVYETASGRKLPDLVPRVNGGTAGGDVAWAAGNTGFFYTRYPRADERPPKDLDFYQQVYFHALGTPTAADTYALGKDFPRIAETSLTSSDDGRSVLASVKNGDGGEVAQHLLTEGSGWRSLAGYADKAVRARFAPDGSLLVLSRKTAPRGQILRLAPGSAELSAAAVLVPQGDAVIDDFCVAGDRLYVADLIGGPSQVRVFDLHGKARGTLSILPVSSVSQMVSVGGGGMLFENQSQLVPSAWYRTGPDGKLHKTALQRTSPVSFADCEVVREEATSKDGTRVPLFLLQRKGTPRDGNAPTLLTGYGGYQISQRPTYSALRRIWMDQGGVFAVAALRGGGEFGEDWHLAGNLTRKQNVFDDFTACAQWLISSRTTRPEKLAIEGGSNGGLLMGAALTQHPELFGAVVAHVGIYDMLRVELSSNGVFNIPEFGSVLDQAQFQALYAYSPYHHVADGAAYPSVLFLTGANDPRVDPMQSRKMTARLQAAGGATPIVLLRTSSSSGHGFGSSLDERIGQATDVYAFLFDRLGVAYRPARAPSPSPRSGGGEGRSDRGT